MPAEIEQPDPRSFERAVEHQRERLGSRHVAPGWAGFFRTIETAVLLGRDGGEVIDGEIVDEGR
jgi:hypothetical protein